MGYDYDCMFAVPCMTSHPSLYCLLSVRVPATSVVGLRSGCFCPDDQMLAEEHKQICVSECPSKLRTQPNITKQPFFLIYRPILRAM